MRRRLFAVLALFSAVTFVHVACDRAGDAPRLNELRRIRAGAIEVVLLSTHDTLREGSDSFVIEFRSATDHHLVDVGALRVSATMSMAGMAPMMGDITAKKADAVGRYAVESDLGMAGSWRLGLEWEGPAGAGSLNLLERVQ